ncbi:hypothetical protein G9A89_000269 [Geosiphon pyriformis]|nr:hypothetical protein G9A89_000269 [Geosiphon pyriformis]
MGRRSCKLDMPWGLVVGTLVVGSGEVVLGPVLGMEGVGFLAFGYCAMVLWYRYLEWFELAPLKWPPVTLTALMCSDCCSRIGSNRVDGWIGYPRTSSDRYLPLGTWCKWVGGRGIGGFVLFLSSKFEKVSVGMIRVNRVFESVLEGVMGNGTTGVVNGHALVLILYGSFMVSVLLIGCLFKQVLYESFMVMGRATLDPFSSIWYVLQYFEGLVGDLGRDGYYLGDVLEILEIGMVGKVYLILPYWGPYRLFVWFGGMIGVMGIDPYLSNTKWDGIPLDMRATQESVVGGYLMRVMDLLGPSEYGYIEYGDTTNKHGFVGESLNYFIPVLGMDTVFCGICQRWVSMEPFGLRLVVTIYFNHPWTLWFGSYATSLWFIGYWYLLDGSCVVLEGCWVVEITGGGDMGTLVELVLCSELRMGIDLKGAINLNPIPHEVAWLSVVVGGVGLEADLLVQGTNNKQILDPPKPPNLHIMSTGDLVLPPVYQVTYIHIGGRIYWAPPPPPPPGILCWVKVYRLNRYLYPRAWYWGPLMMAAMLPIDSPLKALGHQIRVGCQIPIDPIWYLVVVELGGIQSPGWILPVQGFGTWRPLLTGVPFGSTQVCRTGCNTTPSLGLVGLGTSCDGVVLALLVLVVWVWFGEASWSSGPGAVYLSHQWDLDSLSGYTRKYFALSGAPIGRSIAKPDTVVIPVQMVAKEPHKPRLPKCECTPVYGPAYSIKPLVGRMAIRGPHTPPQSQVCILLSVPHRGPKLLSHMVDITGKLDWGPWSLYSRDGWEERYTLALLCFV